MNYPLITQALVLEPKRSRKNKKNLVLGICFAVIGLVLFAFYRQNRNSALIDEIIQLMAASGYGSEYTRVELEGFSYKRLLEIKASYQ